MSELDEMLIRLHRAGYRTHTTGDRVVIEQPNGNSRIIVSTSQLKRIFPLLSKMAKGTRGPVKQSAVKKGIRALPKRRRRTKVKLSSQARAISSVYRQRGMGAGAPPRQGGLPGLGKRH